MTKKFYYSKVDKLLMNFKENLKEQVNPRVTIEIDNAGQYVETHMMIDRLTVSFSYPIGIDWKDIPKIQKSIYGTNPKELDEWGVRLTTKIKADTLGDLGSLYGWCEINGNHLLNGQKGNWGRSNTDTLDGKSNVLINRQDAGYGRNLRRFIYNRLIPEIGNCFSNSIESTLGQEFPVPYGVTTSFNHVEHCLDIVTTLVGTRDFMRMFTYLRDEFRMISVSPSSKNGILKGAKFEIEKGKYIVIYFKSIDLIRLEIRNEKDYIQEKIKKYRDIFLFCDELQKIDTSIFKNTVVEASTYRSELDADEAFLELRSIIKESYFPSFLRKICEGDGTFVVKSSNQNQYREVRRLLRLEIVKKWPKQGTYILNQRYKELIKLRGISARILNQNEFKEAELNTLSVLNPKRITSDLKISKG
ncbi:MAG: hypothetical protein COW00_13655 [Bdellovibrio sp. CG12_big_fil_rev_8_21_14_0_65_39_13]|nr:MAG: hypothetical protein COW78_07080 [Bdellovibrio sp. CG22_combo_CG10-13_8_21_14_all_39_27]PIQ58661.1 MAG: hypothetical protein COW00_13655 [Bdellovibrio sp. CG12_big_fil_rev_8_21_14_0_65_39_13]PIR33036.1 MAG: hypothetical protein COV37_18250 [Bdellovibrio sp. CG11_big_fil_rev_8_21_14_0_20_39_38]